VSGSTPPPGPRPPTGDGGRGAKSQAASPVPSPARRRLVAALALLPWALLLFEFLLVLPRYDQLFRQYGLTLDSLTRFLLDVSAWVRAHAFLTFLITFALVGVSVGTAYGIQTARVSRARRLLILAAVFAVPCALFVLSWVGVLHTHRTLVEGLKR
jgi:type II secretory pathway component PulF